MKLKIILFNLSIIIFLICLIYLYIYVNYKYEGFEDPTAPPVKDSTGEVFRPEGATQNPITDKTTESNVLNESATIAKINPTLSELEKVGVSPETAISARVMPYFNVSRAATNKPALNDGYYWVDFNETDLTGALTSYAGATLNPIAGSKDQYLLYNSSGSLILRENYICDILVVGGGGGGGGDIGGGGGGGGVVYQKNVTLSAGIYTINVGAGGIGPAQTTSANNNDANGTNGGDSFIQINDSDLVINGIRYRGGGGGGGGRYGYPSRSIPYPGNDGGSGGGGSYSGAISVGGKTTQGNTYFNGSTNVTGGNNGAPGYRTGTNSFNGGGGGGAGGAANIKNGGSGVQIDITGTNQWYAAGGGGGIIDDGTGVGGSGGNGIGGDGNFIISGGKFIIASKHSGTPNTGSGGGGGAYKYNNNSNGGGNGGSGVVIIRFKERASMGKKYTYCLMNKNYFGGGWMLAMRAVRGSRTFGYNSEHWTNATTLNDTIEKIREVSFDADLNVSSIGNAIFNDYNGNTTAINRYDAKFDIFNRYKANEWMAIFYFKNDYGVVMKGGDLISGGNHTAKGWIWRETNLIEADKIERTPLQLFQKRNRMDRNISLIDLRGNYGVNNVKNLDKFKPASGMPQLWSSQHGYNFYGINYDVPEWYEGWGSRGASTRWGFAWNENWDYANNNLTNDVYGGIGLRFPGAGQPGYSAGDFIYCCEEFRGANSSIAFEWYVR